MQAVAEQFRDRFEPALRGAYSALDVGDVTEARRLARDVLLASRGSDIHLEASALLCLAHCDRVASPRLRRAMDTSRRAAQLFEQIGEVEGEAQALITLSHLSVLLGRNDEAVEAALMAVRICEEGESHLRPRLVLAYNALGLAYSWSGDHARADRALESAIQMAMQSSPPVSIYQPRLNQMWVEVSRLVDERSESGRIGDLTRLQLLGSDCRELESRGDGSSLLPGLQSLARTLSHASRALLAAWQGDVDVAEFEIKSATGLLTTSATWLHSFVHWTIGELAWTRGDTETAAEALIAMKDSALLVEHEQLACRAHLVLAQLYVHQGRSDDALAEQQALRRRERRMVVEAIDSRESLVSWQLQARQRERHLQQIVVEAQEANQANRAKTRFLAAASHDLRQPIHSLNVLVAALSLRELDDRSRSIVDLLDTVNQTLSSQLDSLLEVSKLDAGVVQADRSIVQLVDLATSLHAMLQPVAIERGLAFLLDAEADVSAETDPSLFARIIGNLIDNAFKFTPAGGSVRLSVKRDGTFATVVIADSGIGIPAEDHQMIFEEFYQVGKGERDRSKGLGLGLSIVARLCDLLDVGITLASAPGAGAEFRLRLPERHALPGTASVATSPDLARGLPEGLAVLVIDDEPMVRDSMRLLLSELGCSTHTADGTEAAARIAGANRIDAVFSDFRLRGDDSGVKAMRAVRLAQPDVCGAMMTGDTGPDALLQAGSVGVRLFRKPLSLRDLSSVLAQCAVSRSSG